MRTKRLKNTASYGGKVLKMNDDVYALRRKVLGVIYDAKKLVDLPRIEVRIVEGAKLEGQDSSIMGYAYMGKNIVHIEKKYVSVHPDTLIHLVLHEVLHAVKATPHNDKCPLMHPIINNHPVSECWKIFESYFKK